MKIYITNPAKNKLFEIGQYYISISDHRSAKLILTNIKEAVKSLFNNTESACKETLLEGLKQNYYRIITGNYKIIFRQEQDQIFITDIFDYRHSPFENK